MRRSVGKANQDLDPDGLDNTGGAERVQMEKDCLRGRRKQRSCVVIMAKKQVLMEASTVQVSERSSR